MRSPFRRSDRGIRRLLSTSLLALSLLVLASPYPPARALAEDVCPEPNDEFQRACYLGTASDALGFIERPEDVDAYRIETLDDNVTAHIEIADAPGAYAFIVGDWNAQPVGQSSPSATGAAVDVALPVAGTYFIFVQSPDGTFSPTTPYRLGITLTYPYPDGSKPQVKYAESFRDPEYPGWLKQLPPAPSGKDADFIEIGGRYMISVNKPGIAQDWPRVASPTFGPDLDDFVLTVDSRACDQDVATGYAGYRIGFRWQDPFHQYSLAVNVEGRRAWLNKVDGTSMKDTVELTEPTRSTYIDNKGGVNRTTIRAQGTNIRISINGGEIINIDDSSFSHGKFNFVAAAWSKARPLATFDNVLITSPSGATSGGPTLAGDPRERQGEQKPLPCKPS
jgi:hypothetical protein